LGNPVWELRPALCSCFPTVADLQEKKGRGKFIHRKEKLEGPCRLSFCREKRKVFRKIMKLIRELNARKLGSK